jgi:hypothetical protein
LKQLTFVGKKTVPAALRKDLWRPMATISFPTNEQGLEAYRELREWRKMHELQYDNKLRLENSKAELKKILQNQKANSVADVAHVLTRQTAGLVPSEGEQLSTDAAANEDITEDKIVRISWANLLDAEYAREWPLTVVHTGMAPSRNVAPSMNPVAQHEKESDSSVIL